VHAVIVLRRSSLIYFLFCQANKFIHSFIQTAYLQSIFIPVFERFFRRRLNTNIKQVHMTRWRSRREINDVKAKGDISATCFIRIFQSYDHTCIVTFLWFTVYCIYLFYYAQVQHNVKHTVAGPVIWNSIPQPNRQPTTSVLFQTSTQDTFLTFSNDFIVPHRDHAITILTVSTAFDAVFAWPIRLVCAEH